MFSYLSQCATTDDNVFRSGGLPPIRRYLTSSLPTPRTLAIRIERRFSPDLAFPASLSPLQYESRIREISEAEARNEPGLRSETGNGPAPPSGRHLPAFRPGRPPTPQLSRLLETHRPRFLALGDQPLPVSFIMSELFQPLFFLFFVRKNFLNSADILCYKFVQKIQAVFRLL